MQWWQFVVLQVANVVLAMACLTVLIYLDNWRK